jgi:hypothetical protein
MKKKHGLLSPVSHAIFDVYTAMKIQVVVFWVVMWLGTDVSEDHAVSTFRVK